MKALKLIGFLSLIFFIILACEDVFELIDNSLGVDPPISDSIPASLCDTCDITFPVDSVPPIDTLTFTYPDDIGSNCDSVGGLWICGIDDPDVFNFDLITGIWWLKQQTTNPNDSEPVIENLENDSAMYNLSVRVNGTFVEVFGGEVIAEGTWEIYPELNNQLWLSTSDDFIFKYYIISLATNEMTEATIMQLARLDHSQPAIIDRIYEHD